METKYCPKCGGTLILFYPNIPYLTGWYCPNNDGHVEPATEAEVQAELDQRNAERDDDL